LRAVEKDLYPSLEASITTTVSMFVDNILTKVTVVGRKNFSKIYIHPVIPVLKETKHLVKPYNATYRSKINTAASSSSSKNIAWLDCLSAFTSIEDEFPRLLKVLTNILTYKTYTCIYTHRHTLVCIHLYTRDNVTQLLDQSLFLNDRIYAHMHIATNNSMPLILFTCINVTFFMYLNYCSC
jgi:hypothetical protein